MRNIPAEEIRHDAPIPIAVRYENGLRYTSYELGELEDYLQKYPDATAEVRDKDGKFITYMDTSRMARLLEENQCLSSDTHLQGPERLIKS